MRRVICLRVRATCKTPPTTSVDCGCKTAARHFRVSTSLPSCSDDRRPIALCPPTCRRRRYANMHTCALPEPRTLYDSTHVRSIMHRVARALAATRVIALDRADGRGDECGQDGTGAGGWRRGNGDECHRPYLPHHTVPIPPSHPPYLPPSQ